MSRIAALALLPALSIPAAADPVPQGAYLTNAAGCEDCHTDREHGGQPYGGGRALATPFGTFYSPNITPDSETGIGRWSDDQFLRALRDGVRPDGANYFPVFPYPSFTKIADADARAIKAYLFSLPAMRQANRAHDVSFPFSWRFLQTGWKFLFFSPGPFQPAPERSEAYNRGAYLVTGLAHCGECHTPRNWFGAMEPDRFLAGNPHGPEGKAVPNITPDAKTGIGKWSEEDITTLLKTGQTPEFDFVGGAMGEVVKNTSRLDDTDRHAIAVYLKSLPPIPSREKGR
ncbi:MAG: cytochrome c [Alphaproteobacteria bacterium]|nr:cytochrome c [Alphaproteobacteria bacterium]